MTSFLLNWLGLIITYKGYIHFTKIVLDTSKDCHQSRLAYRFFKSITAKVLHLFWPLKTATTLNYYR